MSAACPKYLIKVTDPSFSALFELRYGDFGIASLTHCSIIKSICDFWSIVTLLPAKGW